MPSAPRKLRRQSYLVCLSIALPFIAHAQAVAPALNSTTLPPAAQTAEDQGILAMKGRNYLLAIQSFEEARATAPDAPELLYNLGLAEASVPGRELRAICWYGAYLTASPQASNATSVKAQIAALDVKSQNNLSHLIASMLDEAGKLPSPDNRLDDVAALWAAVGNFTSALNTAAQIQDPVIKSKAQSSIAAAQAQAGDLADALKTAGLIQYGFYKNSGESEIAKTQAQSGDIAGARKTAELIQDARSKCSAQVVIANTQTKVGDLAGAKETLVSALQTAGLIQVPSYQNTALGEIAAAQAQSGDIDGACNTAGLIQDANLQASTQIAIANAQAQSGDLAGARKTLTLAANLADPNHESGARGRATSSRLTQALANLNSVSVATSHSTIALSVPIQSKNSAAAVSAWLDKLVDSRPYGAYPLNTAPFLNWDDYAKTLPSAADPQKLFDAQHGVAQIIVRTQTAIDGMLTKL